MPRRHFLSSEALREMRERFRFGKQRLDDLATAYGYAFRASVKNAILRYEASRGLRPDQREEGEAPVTKPGAPTGA